MQNEEATASVEQQIIQLEMQALQRWCNGDSSGFLEISAPDVVYFDPFLERRITGARSADRILRGPAGQDPRRSF